MKMQFRIMGLLSFNSLQMMKILFMLMVSTGPKAPKKKERGSLLLKQQKANNCDDKFSCLYIFVFSINLFLLSWL